MRSDEIKMPKLEVFPEDTCKGVRLFAYSSALSGKEGSASSSSGDTAKASYGSAGLMNEFEKTKLNTCADA